MANNRISQRLEALERRLPPHEDPADEKPYVPPPGWQLATTVRRGDEIIHVLLPSYWTGRP